MPLHMLILNDDVLRQVADYLLGSDALSFSLTSKYVYELAVHRISAVIECRREEKLRLLHRAMVLDNPWRAKHNRKLVVHEDVLTHEGLYGPDRDEGEDEDWGVPVLSMWGPELRPKPQPEPPVGPLIVDLLRLASNIRNLTIRGFDALHTSDPGVLESITTTGQLTRLELTCHRLCAAPFHEQNTGSMGFLLGLLTNGPGRHLVVLSLECPYLCDDHFYPLLLGTTTTAFPRLLVLRLVRFHPRQSFLELNCPQRAPSFPSLRKLFLEDVIPAAFDFVGLCPSVSLVWISTENGSRNPYGLRDEEYYDIEEETPRALGPRWNLIRSLTLFSRVSMRAAQPLLAPAFHLQVTRPMSMDDRGDPSNTVLLLDTFRKVSPVRAQLALIVGEAPLPLWKLMPEVAPRLRLLELKISLEYSTDSGAGLVRTLQIPPSPCFLVLTSET